MKTSRQSLEDLVKFAGSHKLLSSKFVLHGKGAVLRSDSQQVLDFCKDSLFPFLQHKDWEEDLWKVYALTDCSLGSLEGSIVRSTPHYTVYTDGRRVEMLDFPLWPVHIVSVPGEQTAFVVGRRESVSLTTAKLLRQIVFFQLELSLPAYALLHSSAMAKAGRVIAFMCPGGDAGSDIRGEAWGKTLAQASCLFLGKFCFVTDDLLPAWITKEGVHVCGYPDYLDLKLGMMETLFPNVPITRGIHREDFGEAHVYLTSRDLKEAYSIATFGEESLPLETIFFVELRKDDPYGLKLSNVRNKDAARKMIAESLRLDHLFSEFYNPNRLGFPRKSPTDFRNDARNVAETLIQQGVKIIHLKGRVDDPREILEAVVKSTRGESK